jgi:pimeloyl-ACP methyl ester carboxylesterase
VLQPRFPARTPIERGFLRLPHGDVHFRAAGQGPVVLALHESPRSSLSLLPVIDALADRYRVIAPDTPGYGLSDPLPGATPGLDDFLDVIAGVLDTLGLERVAIYGTHTGAALATAFALRAPDRVSALVLDGLSAFTADEVEAFRTRYLEPYAPAWNGRHVMGLWSRVKDLFTWFPWYDQTPAARLAYEPGDLATLDRSALGFLQAGNDYAKAYILAASFPANTVMQNLTMPATIIARPQDLIASHLDRLVRSDAWEIRWLGPSDDEWSEAMVAGVMKGETPDEAGRAPAADQGSKFVPVGAGWLHVAMAGPADGPVRVLLPGLPGDVKALLGDQGRAHPHDRLVVLTPPGCGWSDPLAGAAAGLDGVVDALDAALRGLSLQPASMAAQGASAVIAELWAARRRWTLPVERLDAPAWLTDTAPLPTRPLLSRGPVAWDGGHLTSAWFQLRDLQLYDVPPGAGEPVRRADMGGIDLARFDRLFRYYVEGPECAQLLEQVIEHLRANPALRASKRT